MFKIMKNSHDVIVSESDLDVKLELKSVMDKIRTFSLGKNKDIVVSSLSI